MHTVIVELRKGRILNELMLAVSKDLVDIKFDVTKLYAEDVIQAAQRLRQRAIARRSAEKSGIKISSSESPLPAPPGTRQALHWTQCAKTRYTFDGQQLAHIDAPGVPDPHQSTRLPRQNIVLKRLFHIRVPDKASAAVLRRSQNIGGIARRVFVQEETTQTNKPDRPLAPSFSNPAAAGNLASVDACSVPLAAQGYLDESNIGTGVRLVKELWPNTNGALARLGIIEVDFPSADQANLHAESLGQFGALTYPGPGLDPQSMRHAMLDLSVLLGTGENLEGIVPGLTSITLMSTASLITDDTQATPTTTELAKAIYLMADKLTVKGGVGSVMLIEMQIRTDDGFLPVLADPGVRQALHYAFEAGVLVIVPSCNDNVDIDSLKDSIAYYKQVSFNTGALLVGSAYPRADNGEGACLELLQADCGYGGLVDCFSWATSVAGLNSLSGDPPKPQSTLAHLLPR